MKSLSLILLLATATDAQSIADVARQERDRQARLQSVMVITTETARIIVPAPEPLPVTSEPTATTDAALAPAAAEPVPATTNEITGSVPARPPAAATPSGADPVKKYNDDVANLRTKIRELLDRETAIQLELNSLTNQLFAPKTNPTAQKQAQDRIGQTQSQLTAVRQELEQARRTLQTMEVQGPPKQ